MKTNTSSNDEHELEKEIFKEKARQLPYNDSLGYLEEELKGFKQGYAKCRADVEKIIDLCNGMTVEELRRSIAKLKEKTK